MPYSFHNDKEAYFTMQRDVTLSHIIPFVQKSLPEFNIKNATILEVGCGEAGVLEAFLEQGAGHCVGIEFTKGRAELAKSFLSSANEADRFSILVQNIHDASVQAQFLSTFDLIVLKDVIEHIHDRPKMMATLKSLLKPNGAIFFGFPPWQMPFGGHQQNSTSSIIKATPWIHLLPVDVYLGLVKMFDNRPGFVAGKREIRDTRISIGDYESLMGSTGFYEVARIDYLSNPIYAYKFGFEPIKQVSWVSALPGIRNFVTTCIYSIVKSSCTKKI